LLLPVPQWLGDMPEPAFAAVTALGPLAKATMAGDYAGAHLAT
jgi:hypothetical protein